MPIITTPGPQLGQSDSGTPSTTSPTSSSTLPPRLQSAFTPTAVHPISPKTPSFDDDDSALDDDDFNFDDDDLGDEESPVTTSSNASAPKTGTALSRMSEEQRRQVITTVFKLVLGKDPSDRDFSYYRFSTLTEDSLIKSLLNLPEHKKLVEKAQEHTSLKQSVNDLDLQVKQLSTSMQGMKQELVTMQDLLVEKNRYIQQIRGTPDLPQATPAQPVNTHRPHSEVSEQTPIAPGTTPDVETKTLPTPMDDVKNLFKGMFGRR